MDIAGGLALTAVVLTVVTAIVFIAGAESRVLRTEENLKRWGTVLGILAALGFIASIWTAVLA